MPKIALEQIEKIYEKEILALDNISLEINKGEFFALVGPSGCGKSSLLRIIAGLENNSSGKLYINKKIADSLLPRDRNIGMVFQNYGLYPHKTVYENIAFSLKVKGLSKSTIKEQVEEIAKILEITDLLDKKPQRLSGGQKQRVAIGRAMIKRPDILLLDEPLSSLDAKLRNHMRTEINKLHKKFKEINTGFTTVYVTHDQVEAMSLADKICLMNFGKIMQVDSPINLYNKPQNKFAASFIGSPSMNILKIQVLEINNKLFGQFGTKNLAFLIKQKQYINDYINKKIWFGVRAEDIFLSNEKNHENLQGELLAIELIGEDSFLYVKFMENTIIIKAKTDNTKNLTIGQKLDFNINMEKIHLFDFFTEERLNN